eukprot:1802426-Rhodomonas_salina.2
MLPAGVQRGREESRPTEASPEAPVCSILATRSIQNGHHTAFFFCVHGVGGENLPEMRDRVSDFTPASARFLPARNTYFSTRLRTADLSNDITRGCCEHPTTRKWKTGSHSKKGQTGSCSARCYCRKLERKHIGDRRAVRKRGRRSLISIPKPLMPTSSRFVACKQAQKTSKVVQSAPAFLRNIRRAWRAGFHPTHL